MTSIPASPSAAASDRRDRILGAAHRLCLAQGLAAVRMEEIASLAKVSKGTLYNHFASKEDLLLAMVVDRFRAGGRLVEQVIGEPGPPRQLLERLLRGLVEMLGAQREHAPLLFQAWAVVAHDARFRAQLDGALRELFREWSAASRKIILAGQASGDFSPEPDAGALAEAISGLVSGFTFRSAFDPEVANPDSLAAALELLVRSRLLADPAPSADSSSSPDPKTPSEVSR
jgi:AcrR family transcriptional regulator